MTFGINAFIAGFDRENLSQITPTSNFLIEVDAYLSETHSFPANISDHPVQSGSIVSDHIVLLPPVINIVGIITDTPLLKFDPLQGLITPSEGRSLEKINALLEMREARELFSISSTLGVKRNYFFKELNIPFTPQDGYSARFTASLKQLPLVTFRFGQKVLNQTQDVSARAAEQNDAGRVTASPLNIPLGPV